jgi:hypothetical protein
MISGVLEIRDFLALFNEPENLRLLVRVEKLEVPEGELDFRRGELKRQSLCIPLARGKVVPTV